MIMADLSDLGHCKNINNRDYQVPWTNVTLNLVLTVVGCMTWQAVAFCFTAVSLFGVGHMEPLSSGVNTTLQGREQDVQTL